ncbi:MAG: carboxypeptidase regulatory-like domain-containing protein, partial [Actinomycetota bacterium]
TDGQLRCWGDNVEGQLGDGTTTTSASPVAVTGIADAVAVSAGDGHTCAVRADASVVCWGRNWAGQLGDGTLDPSLVPVPVLGVDQAAAVSAGVVHSCVVGADGGVQCWGRSGLLGDGSELGDGDGVLAVDAVGLTDATAVEASLRHSCATTASGASCWGTNRNGELGVGDAVGRTVPTPVLLGPVEAGISGRVTDGAAQGVENVTVDLYTADPNTGARADYLRSVTSAADGTWAFVAVEPGCYVVTVVAPLFGRFPDGSGFLNFDVCVAAGQPATGLDAVIVDVGQSRVRLTARVIDDETLDPVAGIVVDVFTGDEDGNRLTYLESAATSADGEIDFGLFEPGCYVLTYIAPDGGLLRSPGSLDQGRWLNRPACLDPGVTFASLARLVGQPESGSLAVSVVDGAGAGVDGVVVDLFVAGGDGGRAAYLRSVSTANGVADIEVPAGCYVTVAIAPSGSTFAGGSPWFEWSTCVEGGETAAVTATLG